MENIVIRLSVRGKIRDIALEKLQAWHRSHLGILPRKRIRIAGQHGQIQSQIQLGIRMAKSAQKPFAEKAGAARDEETQASQVLQFRGCMAQNVGEIRVRESKEIFL